MRVLAVTPWLPTRVTPVTAPLIVSDVLLLQQEHEVVVLHLGAPGDLQGEQPEVAGLRVIRIPFHQSQPRTWLPAARELKKYSRSADLVHTMGLPALLPTWLANIRKPWVHTEHYGMLIAGDKTARQRRSIGVLRRLLSKPGQAVAVSEELAKVVSRARQGEPVPVIENYVPMGSLDGREEEAQLSKDKPLLMVAVGGLAPHKGPVQAVEALAELRGRGWDASLTWVGGGALEKEVRQRARELGVEDELSLPGPVAPEELGSYLDAANLFLLPTEHETFGIALAEALGNGLPVVTSGHGQHTAFLPDHASRVAASRDGRILADSVEELVGDPQLWSPREIVDYAQRRFNSADREADYAWVYSAATRDRAGRA